MINDFSTINKDIIINVAKRIKRVNIITNHIDKCRKIEEYLYNEFGIILNISNNSLKSLSNSKIIINLDYPEELVNKYRIYDKAIIINVNDRLNIKSKRFNGLNINYYKISMPNKYKLKEFRDELIYESIIYKKSDYKVINEMILKDKICIDGLIGSKGKIRKQEFIEI